MKKSNYYLLLSPVFILITIVLMFPIIKVIFPSFIDTSLTFNNYLTFLRDSFYQKILARTIKLSLIVTIICIIMGVPTAYFISIQNKKIKSILNILILFPLLTNAVIRSFAWMSILGNDGLLSKLLNILKIISEPKSFMYTEFAIVVGSVYLFLPLMITTLVSIMENFDNNLINASLSLGAKPYQVFFKIIIPLSFSGIIIASVLVFTGTLSAYTTPSLLGGNQNMMLATLLYQQANQLSNWSQAGLISMIMITLSVLIMKLMNIISNKLDKRGSVDV